MPSSVHYRQEVSMHVIDSSPHAAPVAFADLLPSTALFCGAPGCGTTTCEPEGSYVSGASVALRGVARCAHSMCVAWFG